MTVPVKGKQFFNFMVSIKDLSQCAFEYSKCEAIGFSRTTLLTEEGLCVSNMYNAKLDERYLLL